MMLRERGYDEVGRWSDRDVQQAIVSVVKMVAMRLLSIYVDADDAGEEDDDGDDEEREGGEWMLDDCERVESRVVVSVCKREGGVVRVVSGTVVVACIVCCTVRTGNDDMLVSLWWL
jgi:hypothetical protein